MTADELPSCVIAPKISKGAVVSFERMENAVREA